MDKLGGQQTIAFPSPKDTLAELESPGEFIDRHIGPDESQINAMLDTIDAPSLSALIAETVPADILSDRPLALPPAQSERATLRAVRKIRTRNQVAGSMIGMGYYGTITPAVIKRGVLENPAWYTAYTPYQAEISQGRLEALLSFQQLVIDLTGMEIANASLLDEATAAAEAMTMAMRMSKSKSTAFFVSDDCHPQTIDVVKTRAEPLGIEIIVGDPYPGLGDQPVFGVLIQYPNSNGEIREPRTLVEAAHAQKALVVACSDLLALALLKPPGEMDVDVVVGSAQRFGVGMNYGGPHAAFFATREGLQTRYTRTADRSFCRCPGPDRAQDGFANA